MTAHLWDPYNTLHLSVLRNPKAIVPSAPQRNTFFLEVAKGHPTSDHAEPGIMAKGLGSKEELWGLKEELRGLEEDS